MIQQESRMLLLVLSLPTKSATARMRIWRTLKSLGCAALRDGVYLLPASLAHRTAFEELASECIRAGGSAWLLATNATSEEDAEATPLLFDRRADFAALVAAWRRYGSELARLDVGELSRLQRKLQREFDALRAIDFFPGDASVEAEVSWQNFDRRIVALLSPDEPQDGTPALRKLRKKDYQSKLWATRKHLWIDRVASAWLIRRFIDPSARFRWLDRPADCPKGAIGFDFDGAVFTHTGELVTFETLMASFGLDRNRGLQRLATIVHALDVGGTLPAEAAGFAAVVGGARDRLADDDALLGEIGAVLDSLYAHFQRDVEKPASTRGRQ